jgi:hypothetical protein
MANIKDLNVIDKTIIKNYFTSKGYDITLDMAYGTGTAITYSGGYLNGPFGKIKLSSFPAKSGYKLEVVSKDGKNIRITKDPMDMTIAQNGKGSIEMKDGLITIVCTGEDCKGIDIVCSNKKTNCNARFNNGVNVYDMDIPFAGAEGNCGDGSAVKKICVYPPRVSIGPTGTLSSCSGTPKKDWYKVLR